VKLYEGWRSSASWRVRWALALKGVTYDSVLVDIAGGEHQTLLAPLNPLRAVPTLVLDDGTILTESVAIIEWLEETRPDPPLLPREPLARAQVRELVQIVNAGIHPLQNTVVMKAVADNPDGQRAWARRWIERGLAGYEAHVAGGKGRYSVGDTVTMADLFLVPQMRNAERHGADVSGLTRVRAIYAACLERAEVQATHPTVVEKRRLGT